MKNVTCSSLGTGGRVYHAQLFAVREMDEKRDCTGWVEPYTVQPLMLSVSVSRLRKGEERAGEREDSVELGEYGENHGLGEDVVAVGHLVDTVAYEAGLLDC